MEVLPSAWSPFLGGVSFRFDKQCFFKRIWPVRSIPMTPETAELVLYAIAGAGALVWIAGLWFLLASRKAGAAAPATGRWGSREDEASRMASGFVDVDGEPDDLLARAASVLAAGTFGALGAVKILERTESKIVLEPVDIGPAGQPRWSGFRRAELFFSSAGHGRTRVGYSVHGSSRSWLLAVGGAFQVLGLLALVAGVWAIRTFVVPSENPGVRWQTIQMVQAIHFLWPPFLFGGLYRKQGRWIRTAFETFIQNLPHLG